ncbi:hypothetical protein OG226_41380 [Streptomyces sp. NBC_01261]|uniref:hypothetical protein n=1 Tax=Streptomyces sp. NBC_01261 TaxID=2903802 RepID=UPI002E36C79B|nr:hypothetical protein [Streptomyces sp. NBC_01261]
MEPVRNALEIEKSFSDCGGTAPKPDLLAWITTCHGDHGRADRPLGAVHLPWRDIGTTVPARDRLGIRRHRPQGERLRHPAA